MTHGVTSFYLPSSSDSSSNASSDGATNVAPTEKPPTELTDPLNEYLQFRDVSPIRSRLNVPWENASERTKRYYLRKAGQAVTAVVYDIAPNNGPELFQELRACNISQNELTDKATFSDCNVDTTLMEALVECYVAANGWETRRQILSIMADKMPFKQLKQWIPDLTKHTFTEAKRHCLIKGRGVPVQPVTVPRTRFSTSQVDHFVEFITSSHIVQDLPFGEKTITLSTRETIKVPNVIRIMIPERITTQYLNYCKESGFEPLNRSTLLRILNICAASTRKSLQGLDYITSAGTEAFDDLCEVVKTLGDLGQGMRWSKEQQDHLRASKHYLKSDYKVPHFFYFSLKQD